MNANPYCPDCEGTGFVFVPEIVGEGVREKPCYCTLSPDPIVDEIEEEGFEEVN